MRVDIAGIGREPDRMDHAAFVARMEEIDRLGYDGVWFNEFHFQTPPQPYPSLLLLAAAVLARTERVRVGTSVLVLPLHNPLVLAEQIAQLDWQSGGRIDIGLGRGTDPGTLARLGIDPASTRERFEDAFAAMRSVWLGTARQRAADGEALTIPVQPCVQAPHPPLYVAGYTEETLTFAGRHGLPLLLSLEPPETRQIEIYRDLVRAHGFPSRLAESSLTRYVVVGRSAADAEAHLEHLLPLLQTRRIYYAGRRGVAPGDVLPIDRELLLRDQLILGDPESCFAQIADLRRRMGIAALRCVFNGNGVLSPPLSMEQMRLFSQEVLPCLRDI
ncbi:luciferase [Hyphomicrobium nitrativorans NL23]|uniref:Luciferase n=1 Tax=Hyphomicrobium nitrativorans NL23 TaxID=1029756 RepID=V5SAB1_9HYPH|nr:LLM class flavin-dependent oxidoreductase [Hyphomicrobium nitrativorans]AHB47686.1 luciferase [Hyphomicrobium nitrativorans NL23]